MGWLVDNLIVVVVVVGVGVVVEVVDVEYVKIIPRGQLGGRN